ncbi:peptidylprolyl isomerase [Flagellimonas allohymeniacidonis]|uniref:peptidylprolyl isomerase n=1 Tax=Flagellimonas allohymeniacidonis TaxID=2517819 RepID=A0A4Q8QFL9_9FLAO|nr:peptidylprolyl isomerase [Allomuricauda hymeniacidonis]TAI49322.1 peptidylprolyl isomerase [Allomuricauda hymeniacidonis]
MKHTIVLTALIALSVVGCKSGKYANLEDGIFADIQTNRGDILVKLYHEATPVTVANFVSLAEGTSPFVTDSIGIVTGQDTVVLNLKGKKYYDGVPFHRIIKDFMIQGGDPTASGSGNPGYKFKDEFNDTLTHSKKGILSMANSGPKTNGSQFFITHKETPWLNGRHTVFGEVVMGIEVVDSIANVATGPQDRPSVDVIMNKVEIVRKGKEAKKFDEVQIMTDYFEEEKAAEAAFKKMKEDLVAQFEQQKKDAEETSSGLRIYSLKKGDGEQPKIGQKVMVLYAGWLTNGDLFDSNYEEIAVQFDQFDQRRKQGGGYFPIPMDYSPEARLIPGFKEGLQSMKVGDKVRLFIPPHLGYGPQGGGPIPPNADLVFDLEITGIQEE